MAFVLFILIDLLFVSLIAYLITLIVLRVRSSKNETEKIKKTFVQHDKSVFVDRNFRNSPEYTEALNKYDLKVYDYSKIDTLEDMEALKGPSNEQEEELVTYLSYLSFMKGVASEVRSKYINMKEKVINILGSVNKEKRIDILKTYPELSSNIIESDSDIGISKLKAKAEELGIETREDLAYDQLYKLVDKICKDQWKKENPLPNTLSAECDNCNTWYTSEARCSCGSRKHAAFIEGNWEIGYNWTASSY